MLLKSLLPDYSKCSIFLADQPMMDRPGRIIECISSQKKDEIEPDFSCLDSPDPFSLLDVLKALKPNREQITEIFKIIPAVCLIKSEIQNEIKQLLEIRN